MTVTTARQNAVAKQDDAIASNVAKIEQTRRPSALEMMASRLNITPNGLKTTLMGTAFKDANDDQFAALIIVANEYGLNPLTKEIYAFPAKGGIVPMVSIDGWIRIMNQHPMFDGIEFVDLPDANGKLYAIESVIYRKDRTRPIRVVEYLEECKRNTDPWNKSPARMLRHRALIQCARYAFGFSGIVSDDEMMGEIQLTADAQPTPAAPARKAKAITHQAARTDEDEATARALDSQTGDHGFDPETGEVHTGGTDDQNEATGNAWDSLLTDWMTRIERAELKSDVAAIQAELETHKAALPDDIVAKVQVWIDGKMGRF
jgi:phage recombination protein Bet